MASTRSPSLPRRDYPRQSSSPDPLALSIHEDSHVPTSRRKSQSQHQSLRFRSPSISNRAQILEDITLSSNQRASPRRITARASSMSMSQTHPTVTSHSTTAITSPWKIRVTVEAEPENAHLSHSPSTSPSAQKSKSPGKQTQTITKTIKVPLRGGSNPLLPLQNGARGREREYSDVDTSGNIGETNTRSKPRKDGTPTRKSASSPARKNRRPSVNDLDVVVLGDDDEENDWVRTRNKSASPRRKVSTLRRKRGSNRAAEERVEDGLTGTSTAEFVEGAGSADDGLEQMETNEHDTTETPLRASFEETNEAVSENNDDSQNLRTVDLNRVSVRSRSFSTKSKTAGLGINTSSQPQRNQPLAVALGQNMRQASGASAKSYPTPSPTSSYHGDSDPVEKPAQSIERHEPFDTILESEGFTMIDLDSIPSAGQFRTTPARLNQPQEETREQTPLSVEHRRPIENLARNFGGNDVQPPRKAPVISRPVLVEGESELSSTVPSSPPEDSVGLLRPPQLHTRTQFRKVTPVVHSSPQLPPPPKVVHRSPRSRMTTPSVSSEVLSAGLALQNMIKPSLVIEGKTLPTNTQPAQIEKQSAQDVFLGFDAGTKRELRAGLRFGEELAKRHEPDSMTAVDHITASSQQSRKPEISNSQPRVQVWRGETVVQRTPQISLSAQIQEKEGALTSNLERKWQLEREAVAQQIKNAPQAQVVVVDDDEDSPEPLFRDKLPIKESGNGRSSPKIGKVGIEEDNDDIWLAEARDSSSPPTSNLFSTDSQRRQRERAREVVNKPKRTLIPSPWKRGEDVVEASTYLSAGDMSGMFWPPSESKLKFGAGQIRQQRKALSGRFDVDLMVGTPKREDVTDLSSIVKEDSAVGSVQPDEHGENALRNNHEVQNCHTDGFRREEDQVEEESNQDEESAEFSQVEAAEEHTPINEPSNEPVKVPVHFNDSTISEDLSEVSEGDTIEVESTESGKMRSPSPMTTRETPPTPRSAMKGARSLSIGDELYANPADRRVVFSRRSRGMDIHGIEDSFSAKESESSIVSAFDWRDIEGQGLPKRAPVSLANGAVENEITTDRRVNVHVNEPTSSSTGWGRWLWNRKPAPAHTESDKGRLDEAAEQGEEELESDSQWQVTKTALRSHTAQQENVSSSKKSKSRSRDHVPSYLLPPSYPADPTRNPSVPLSLSGEFTRSHFRTMHIIHGKSQRARFHRPRKVRRGLKQLMGLKIDVDESDRGMGLFEWVVGEREVLVLERFMQEVEHGWRCAGREEELVWAWSEEQLANWLCRIVVGEVVREEEKIRK